MFTALLFPTLFSTFSPSAAATETEHYATTIATVGWVSDGDNRRSTISLLYNCLFTVFLCTWSAMHLNVPAETDTELRTFLRKCGWMLVGVLAPEYVAALAIGELYSARAMVRHEAPHLPTATHGFFAIMGGYAIDVKDDAGPNASSQRIRLGPEDFLKLAKRSPLQMPIIEDLMDKSKSDWISKSITSAQVIWFVSQLIGRAAQRLPVTTLELFTAAIIVCSAATYIAWWDKPLDVQRPLILDIDVSAAELARFDMCASERYVSIMPDYSLPDDYELTGSRLAPFILGIVLAFAALHMAGWNFYFPTRIEKILWRVASAICAGSSTFLVATFGFLHYVIGETRAERRVFSIMYFVMGVYLLVRAYLLVEVFVGLRSVPADVYLSVNWSAYIPHI